MPAGMDDVAGPEAWFNSLPFITRYWFASALVATLGGNFGIVSPRLLIWSWDGLKDNFEVWRLLTPFMYVGPFHISTLIGLFMLLQFSRQYEAGGPFNTGGGGGTADYVFMLLLGAATLLGTYPLLAGTFRLSPLFTRSLVYYVLYVWSKRNPTAPANIWGVPMQGMYLPFAYLAITVLMGGSVFDMLHGLALGHIYYFIVDVYPKVYGKDLLHTPRFLIDLFGVGEYVPPIHNDAVGNNTWNAPGRVNPPPNQPGADGRRVAHPWGGGGRVLGTG